MRASAGYARIPSAHMPTIYKHTVAALTISSAYALTIAPNVPVQTRIAPVRLYGLRVGESVLMAAAFGELSEPTTATAGMADAIDTSQFDGKVVGAFQGTSVEVLAPGLLIVRGALSESEQKFILEKTHELGARTSNGFASAGTSGRGRLYERCELVPGAFSDIAIRTSQVATAKDVDMPACAPTHVLINKYFTKAGLLWHRPCTQGSNTRSIGCVLHNRTHVHWRVHAGDIYSNDGDGNKPVINLSVGASCKFGVELPLVDTSYKQIIRVELHSGDAILFGGPNRFVKHAVLGVLLDKTPAWMTTNPCRVSLTFRDAASVLGREDFFRNFDVSNEWFERTQTEWRAGDPLVEPEVAEAACINEDECMIPYETTE